MKTLTTITTAALIAAATTASAGEPGTAEMGRTSTTSTAAGVQESGYTDQQIENAIRTGVEDKTDRIMHSCTASRGGRLGAWASQLDRGGGTYLVIGHPPLARVAEAARTARETYRPNPTTEEARDLIGEGVFTVRVIPRAGSSMRSAEHLAVMGLQHVVVRPRGDRHGRQTVQPLAVEPTSRSIGNLFGAAVTMEGAVATFHPTRIREIIAEKDLEVIVITDSGDEMKCNLDDTRLKRGFDLR